MFLSRPRTVPVLDFTKELHSNSLISQSLCPLSLFLKSLCFFYYSLVSHTGICKFGSWLYVCIKPQGVLTDLILLQGRLYTYICIFLMYSGSGWPKQCHVKLIGLVDFDQLICCTMVNQWKFQQSTKLNEWVHLSLIEWRTV